MQEIDIEDYLVARVKAIGGEVRKVKWIARRSAPDRCVMLPLAAAKALSLPTTVWVELKAPGKKATFPSDGRERAQKREHDRMRKAGQTVFVLDSFAEIDALLTLPK